ncbi:conserved exported hypothetical protein [Microbacterium sp. 8M]|uniref:hypothetical protein n=1 Tax=Microbacterium sp. 8M TaxID=2653153 RepID=UPI0012F35A67|nr:hypothetical protein [Microbacterium sp. 8M]VXB09848.1 conserved exported hypothetical protein [Microbacterium sp. 8M]
MRPLLPALLAVAVAVLALAGCTPAPAPGTPSAQSGVAATTLPGLATPTGEPDLASLHGVHPEPGQAVTAAGPFDDRFVVHDLAFDGSAVTGTIEITSDVSDVLELMVVAGFYDAQGALLGTARFERHGEDHEVHAGPPSEATAFRVDVPDALRGTAASAAIGVPVLVNE